MRIDLLTQTYELEALAPEWRALWLGDARATPFQSPEWLLPWWRHVGEGTLHTLTLRDAGGRLQAILPGYIYPQRASGERQLLLLGAGTSDYLDGIFAPGADPAPLLNRSGPYDRAIFHQLRPSSPLCHAQALTQAEPTFGLEAAARLPAKINLNRGRYLRRAQARGTLEFSLVASQPEALYLLDRLTAFHHARWESRGEPAVLAPAAVQAHHRESIPALLAADLLRLFSLTLGGEVVGVLYCMLGQSGDTLFFYLIAFEERFADLSPGTLLLHFAHEYCLAHRISRLDFLRGGERYKHFWGATETVTYTVTLGGKG